MRIDLEMIKKIEAYLTGTMDPAELKAFEQELNTNIELRNAVEQQRNLMKAMEKTFVRNAAKNAGKKVRMYKLLKISGIVVLSVSIILTVILLVFNGNDKGLNESRNRGEGGDGPTSTEVIGGLLPLQNFTIDPMKDVTLTCMKGTKVFIPDSTFVDELGNIVNGPIEIEVKECLDKYDMVIGNMATLTNGSILESGGMIYINATSNGKQLGVSSNKELTIEVPTVSTLPGMQLFAAEKTKDGINWVNPRSLKGIENPTDSTSTTAEIQSDEADVAIKKNDWPKMILSDKNGFTWSLISYMNSTHYNDSVNRITPIVLDYMQEGHVDDFVRDTTITLSGMQVRFYILMVDGLLVNNDINDKGEGKITNLRGINSFQEDRVATYVYTTKKLGWANIDRLLDDPRIAPVDMIVEVPSNNDFYNVTTSMVFDYKEIYLPGYQTKDGKFSYSHGDYEKMELPVGENATLIAIGYKNGSPFLCIQKITIAKSQNVVLPLKPVMN
jgi:hypothetical protein